MVAGIKDRGGRVYLEAPEYFTVRANVPELGHADFVLCRKDGEYTDGRRPDDVEPGTLMDDLARRDFTMNAMALDEDGTLIDPFDGQVDLRRKFIRCVGKAEDRFSEDALRILRAVRFAITKDLDFAGKIFECLHNPKIVEGLKNVSIERIREELNKCFKYDTLKTLGYFYDYNLLAKSCFRDNLRLEGTLKH